MDSRTNLPHHNLPAQSHSLTKLLLVVCLALALACVGGMHQAQADEPQPSLLSISAPEGFDTFAYEIAPMDSVAVEPPRIKTDWRAQLPYYVVGLEPGDVLNLSSETPDAVIYYTTDGSSPVASQGKLSAAAMKYNTTDVIAKTTTYRAVAVTGCNETAKTFDEQSEEKRFFVHTDNLNLSPYVTTDDDETPQTRTISGSWERVKYSDLAPAMAAEPNSLPYCNKAEAGAAELRSTVLQPFIYEESCALSVTVWRSSSYDTDDMVTPTITPAAPSPETQQPVVLQTSIPLKTASGEADGWYTYYFGAASHAGTSVYCGVRTSSSQPVYVDDMYTTMMSYSAPTWEAFKDGVTQEDKLKLVTATNNAKYQFGSALDATTEWETLRMGPLHDLVVYPVALPQTLYYGQYSVSGAFGRSALASTYVDMPSCEQVTFLLNGVSVEASDDIEKPTMCDYSSKVELTTTEPNATIYYTTDRTTPTTDSQVYNPNEPLFVKDSLCVLALTQADGREDSSSVGYFHAYPGPNVEVDGEQSAPGVVRLGSAVSFKLTPSCDEHGNPRPTDGYRIYYTTDGTEPYIDDDGIIHGELYGGPLVIDTDVDIIARALKVGSASGVSMRCSYQVTDAADSFEPNDTQDAAASISFPFQVQATIDIASDVDYYRFSTSSTGTYTFTLTNPADRQFTLELYAADATMLATGQGTSESSAIVRTNFAPGTYFLKVYSTAGSCVAPYTLLAAKNIDADATPLDFSESSMATHMLGCKTTQSYTRPNGINGEGHIFYSTAYFARWDGPVDEAVEPYGDGTQFVDPLTWIVPLESDTNLPLYNRAEHPEKYHLDSTLLISKDLPGDVRDATLKSAILSYGAATMSIWWAGTAIDPTNTYYYLEDESQATGVHGVTAVGWDDTIPAEKFEKNGVKPGRDGAFIIKNSYGEDFGDGGFFYISYDNAGSFVNDPAVIILSSTDDANVLYQHDPLGCSAYHSLSGNVGYAKNVFTASSQQTLSSVSFFITGVFTDYDVYVQVGDEPEVHVASGCKSEAGYYTVDLASVIEVAQGERFSVTVRQSTRDDTHVCLALQSVGEDSPNAARYADEGFSYYSEDGTNWTDLYSIDKSVACIKVQAIDAGTDVSVVITPETNDTSVLAALDAQQSDRMRQMSDGESSDSSAAAPDSETPKGLKPLAMPYDSVAATAAMPTFEVPEKFDLRDIDGSGTSAAGVVQNQAYYGTCWCFNSCASAESVLMRRDSFTPTTDYSINAGSDQVVHLTEENPTATVALNATLVSSGDDYAANDYISWSFAGTLDGAAILNHSSNSGVDTDMLTVSQPGTITAEATSAANVLKTARTTITVVDDRESADNGDAGVAVPTNSKTLATANAKTTAATGDQPLVTAMVLMMAAAGAMILSGIIRKRRE